MGPRLPFLHSVSNDTAVGIVAVTLLAMRHSEEIKMMPIMTLPNHQASMAFSVLPKPKISPEMAKAARAALKRLLAAEQASLAGEG